MYFVIHTASPKYVFYHPYSFLQNAFHQVLFVHPSISADLLGLLDGSSIFYGYNDVPSLFFHGCCGMGGCKFAVCLGDHPCWMNVIHFWWIFTMLRDGCYKLAYCLGWSSILDAYPRVFWWVFTMLWNGCYKFAFYLSDRPIWMHTIHFWRILTIYGMVLKICFVSWMIIHFWWNSHLFFFGGY